MRFAPVLAGLLGFAVLAAAAPSAPARGGKADPPPTLSPEKAEEKVRELLSSYRGTNRWGTADRAYEDLLALGRAAAAPLMRVLREEHNAGHGGPDMVESVAKGALAEVAGEADFKELASMLADGVLTAAKAMARLRNPKAAEALLVPLRKGWMDWDLAEGLKPFASDKAVRRALVEWMEKYGKAGGNDLAAAARMMGEAGVFEAVPGLKAFLASGEGEAYTRTEVAKALVALKEKDGVKALLEVFAAIPVDGRPDHERHDAGEVLNKVVGERIYIGSYGPGSWGAKGNFDEALAKFGAWWEKAEKTLHWDPKKLKWTW